MVQLQKCSVNRPTASKVLKAVTAESILGHHAAPITRGAATERLVEVRSYVRCCRALNRMTPCLSLV